MSVEDMLKGKRVSVGTADKTSACSNREFQELSFDAAKVQREKNICPEDLITAVIEGAVTLLNLPAAIQQKATLDAYKATFEVESRDAENGKVECTVNKDHVKCRCHSFKYDSVCKHSIAVAARVGMLEEHIRNITRSSGKKGQRTTLAEANVMLTRQSPVKKGSTCRYPYRLQPSVQRQSVTERAFKQPASHMYTQIHHNDNPFVLRILPKDAKNCKQCKNDFFVTD